MPVNVSFGATTQALESGVDRAKSSLGGMLSPIEDLQSAFADLKSSVTSSMSEIGSAVESTVSAISSSVSKLASSGGNLSLVSLLGGFLGGGGGAAAVVGALVAAIVKADEAMIKLQEDAKETNLTLERFQEVQFAAKGAGVSDPAASLKDAAGKMNDMLHGETELSKLLDANNIKWKDTNGQLISMDQYLVDANRLIANAATEQDKFKIADILGFSREWVQLLEQSPEAIQQAEMAAHKAGAVIDADMVQKSAEFAKKWKEASQEWGDALKAILIELTSWVQAVINIWGGIIEAAKIIWANVHGIHGEAAAMLPAMGELAKHFTDGAESAEAFAKAIAAANQHATNLNAHTGPTTVIPKDDDGRDADNAREAMSTLRGLITAQNEQYTTEAERLKNSVTNYQMTEAQKTALTITAINQREDIELAAARETLGNQNLSVAQRQPVENDITQIVNKAIKDRQAAYQEETKYYQQQWQSALSSITGSFNSQLRGLLAGTTSFSQAWKSMTGDMLIKFIEMTEQMAVKWIAAQLGMTTAAVTGAAARTAAEQTSSTASIAGTIANALKSIFASAGQTTAEVTAAVAPTTGPAAPAVGAAAGAATLASALAVAGASFAVGTDYITRGGFALLHTGEKITPAQGSGPFTGAGMGGDTHIHNWNISAVDGSSVQRWLSGVGARQIANAVAGVQARTPSMGW